MRTRAMLLAAAAVFVMAPAYADNHTDNDNAKRKATEQGQDVRSDAKENRSDARQDRHDGMAGQTMDPQARNDRPAEGRMDRQDRHDAVAESRMDRRITSANINEFRANANAVRRYHYGQAWVAPYGWRYQRFVYGQRMPNLFYGQNYWIVNFGGYGLYAPPMGYQWVRYGNDAVLVDLSTGLIIRIQYNSFY